MTEGIVFYGKHPERGWLDMEGNEVQLDYMPENDYPVLGHGKYYVSTNIHDYKMYDHVVYKASLNCDLAPWIVVPKTYNRIIACMRGTTVMYLFEDIGYMNFPVGK